MYTGYEVRSFNLSCIQGADPGPNNRVGLICRNSAPHTCVSSLLSHRIISVGPWWPILRVWTQPRQGRSVRLHKPLCSQQQLQPHSSSPADIWNAATQLEDAYAACLFNNWQFSLLLDDCKNTQLWTCADCQAAYKAWLCASVFPRCSGSPEQRVPTCRNTCFVCPPFRQALLLASQTCVGFSTWQALSSSAFLVAAP